MSLFTMLPFVVNDPTLPVIPAEDIDYLVNYEAGSYAHWEFGGTAESLADLKSGKLLTPQSNTHAFTENSVIVKTDFGQFLESDYADSRNMTWVVVMKRPVSPPTGGTGILGTGNTDGVRFIQAPNDTVGRVIYRVGGLGDRFYLWPVSVGEYLFIAGYCSGDELQGARGVYFGGNSGWPEPGDGSPKVLAPGNLSLGNNANSVHLAGLDLEFAEFIIFDRALESSEIQAVYYRSQARMAGRGIVI